MKRRLTVAIATTAALGLTASTAAAAIPRNQIRIVGGIQIKLGRYVKDNQRFKAANPGATTIVKSGATVTVKNRATTQDPHTISFTQRRFLPGTDFDTPIFPLLGQAHGVPEDNPEGEPTILVVDDGAAVPAGEMLRVNTPFTTTVAGDSAFLAPGTKEFKFKVTAAKGSRLHYFCAIHPWMRGKIAVD